MFAVIFSTTDPASMNIKECLLEMAPFKETFTTFDTHPVYEYQKMHLYTTDRKSVECERFDEVITTDYFIFPTKHVSSSGVHSLTVHGPGNFGSNDMGGISRRLAVSASQLIARGLCELEKLAPPGFEVIQEATHHGPDMNKPCMFIEIGSDETTYHNKDAGTAIAKAILSIVVSEKQFKVAIGIGGLHHCPNFKKLTLEHDIALAHVCPKYNLSNLDYDMLVQMIERVDVPVETIVVDWKGLGEHKARVSELLESVKLPVKRTREFNTTSQE